METNLLIYLHVGDHIVIKCNFVLDSPGRIKVEVCTLVHCSNSVRSCYHLLYLYSLLYICLCTTIALELDLNMVRHTVLLFAVGLILVLHSVS